MLFCLILLNMYSLQPKTNQNYDFTSFLAEIEEFESYNKHYKDSVEQIRNQQKSTKTYQSYKSRKSKPQNIIVELNSADTNELVKLYGIGQVYAKRIVKYRRLLGGYYHSEQLLEVYGFDTVTYKKVCDNIIIDTTLISSININTASFKELLKHPYLNYDEVKSIVNWKDKKGAYASIRQLTTNSVINENTYNKIKHYLTIIND